MGFIYKWNLAFDMPVLEESAFVMPGIGGVM